MSRLRVDEINHQQKKGRSHKKLIIVLFFLMIMTVISFFYVHTKWVAFHQAYSNAYIDQQFKYETSSQSNHEHVLFIGVDYQDAGHLSERKPMSIAIIKDGKQVQFIHPERLSVDSWQRHPSTEQINQIGEQVQSYLHTDIHYTLVVSLDSLSDWLETTGPLSYQFRQAVNTGHLKVNAHKSTQLNNRQLAMFLYPIEGEEHDVYQQRQMDIWYQSKQHLGQFITQDTFDTNAVAFFDNVITNIPEEDWVKQTVLDYFNQERIPEY